MKKNPDNEFNQAISGPICPLPNSKGDAVYKGGALSSAFVSVVLWYINIILAGLGLGSVAIGAWLSKYRFLFVGITMTLLGISFYKTYFGSCHATRRNKITLWVIAGISISLTLYSLFRKNL